MIHETRLTARALVVAILFLGSAGARQPGLAGEAPVDPPTRKAVPAPGGLQVAVLVEDAGGLLVAAPLRESAETLKVKGRTAGRIDLQAVVERVAIGTKKLTDGNIYHQLSLDGLWRQSEEPGQPALPCHRTEVPVPAGNDVRLVIDRAEWKTLAGEWSVAPVQHPIPGIIGHDDSKIPFAKDEAAYRREAFGGRAPVRLERLVRVRGRQLAVVTFAPFDYNPGRKALRVASNVEWHLEFRPAQAEGGAARPAAERGEKAAPEAEDDSGAFLPAQPAPANAALTDAAPAAATASACDYLIVVADAFRDAIGPLAAWRRRAGLDAYVAGYPSETGSGENALKSYIAAAYAGGSGRLAHVLLVGDHENVPSVKQVGHPYHGDTHVWYSDKPYTWVDGADTYPDMTIGRFACDTEAQVTIAVNKTLTYETVPPDGDWYRHAVLAAQNDRAFEEDIHRVADFLGPDYDFFGSWNGYSGADPFNKGYSTHVAVNGFMEYSYSYPLRITPPSPTPDAWKALGTAGATQISSWINTGASFVMHRDHGSTGGWGTPGYSTSNVSALTNGTKLPAVFSINCLTGQFDGGDYFGEAWLRNPNGGAVAFFGHMRVSYSGYNDTLHVGIMDSLWDDYSSYTNAAYPASRLLGDVNNRACAAVGFTGTYGYLTYRMFHLLGDPAVSLRTCAPLPLTATHPDGLAAGQATSFDVVVLRDGAACPGAAVTLVGKSEYRAAVADNQGTARFSFTPAAAGTLLVTAVAPDSLPYRGSLEVGSAPNSAPVAAAQAVSANEDTAKAVTLTGSDADGDALSFVLTGFPAHGKLSGTGANRTYTPVANYNGADSFSFKVNDGLVDSAAAVVSLTVVAVNDAPVAAAQTVHVIPEIPKAITLTATDIDGNPLTYSPLGLPAHGSLSGTGAGQIYTSFPGYQGPDSFTFRAHDGQAYSNTATVTLKVSEFYGHWKLDETSGTAASDASAYLNNGTLRGGPAWNAAGKLSGALNLDGVDDYVSTALSAPAPNVFTLALWLKTTTVSGGRLLGCGSNQTGGSSSRDRQLYLANAGQVYFGVESGTFRAVNSSAALNDGNWHHVAATLSGAGMALYVDGVLVAADATVTAGKAYTGYWRIGYDTLSGTAWPAAPSSSYFAGTLDDVRVYARALSAGEIAALAGNASNLAPLLSSSSPSSPFSMNEGQTQFFSVEAWDPEGDPLTYAWQLDGAATGGNAAGFSYSPSHTAAGVHTLTVTVSDGMGGSISQTWAVTVLNVPLPPTVAAAAAANPNPADGTTCGLSVLGADEEGEAVLEYTWATAGTPPAVVSFSPNGTNAAKNCTATFTKAGSYTLQATLKDAANLTATSSVSLTVNQTLTAITVTPAVATVASGGTQQFGASGTDQFGADLVSQPAFTWAVSGGGTIGSDGIFTAGATTGGPHTVTASAGGKSGTASVTVTAVTHNPGDLNGDHVVSIDDLVLVTSHWGQTPSAPNWDPRADANDDGVVNIDDLSEVTGNFGETYP